MKTIGIIGGGQLGQMLIKFGFDKLKGFCDFNFKVLNPTEDCSCANIKDNNVQIIVGSLQDEQALKQLCEGCDVITWEIENVNVEALLKLEDEGHNIIPNPSALKILQDKGTQKLFYRDNHIPIVPFTLSSDPLKDFWCNDGTKKSLNAVDGVMYKLRFGGYDGRGVKYVTEHTKEKNGWNNLVIEEFIKYKKELSVIVVIDKSGKAITYSPVQMEFSYESNILSNCKPETDAIVVEECLSVALKTAKSFNSPGIYAVEMFLYYRNDELNLVVNETSLRVHNSGHHTIHTHNISQFEMLARIMIGLPIKQPTQLWNHFIMKNLYLPESENEGPYIIKNRIAITDTVNGPFIVDYNKRVAKKWRKMAHITHVGNSEQEVYNECSFYNSAVQICTSNAQSPLVGVIMGSDSDWKVMKEACDTLIKFNIPFETTVVSAHRTPERLRDYATTAQKRGLRVIIAGAGGAAHLPGMIAAQTCLPVIGVPIQTSTLQGVDSLHSIVQMPPGVPVACMAINGAKNAGIYAVQILGDFEKITDQRKETSHDVIMSSDLQHPFKKIY